MSIMTIFGNLEGGSSKIADIVYFKSPWTNIGNAFIDMGAVYQLRKVAPSLRLHIIGGGLTNIIYNFYTLEKARRVRKVVPGFIVRLVKRALRLKARKLRDSVLSIKYTAPWSFELITAIEAKYIVVAGVALSGWFVALYGETIRKLCREKRRLIVLGGGATSYSEEEANLVRSFLRKVKPYIIVTRDRWCYENFSDLAEYSYNGVDCGFFVSETWKPPLLNLGKYVVFAFDKMKEPEIRVKYPIIRVHHSFWTKKDASVILRKKPNTFVSDYPYDYLALYANATEVYTDRVHACVVAYAYGVPCHLYSMSPRAKLFERLGEDPRKKPMIPDLSKLKEEKRRQLKFLSETLGLEQ